jgi:hypothetical protein
VTFGRGSGKFPSMKAWINIYAIVLAAGTLTVLAQEAKTNAPAAATTGIPAATNLVAVPTATAATSAPAPAVVHKVKPPPVVPLTTTSSIPAQSNIIVASPTASTSAPPVTSEAKAPEEESLTTTDAVPAQPGVPAALPLESSGMGWKNVLAIIVAILAVAGGLAAFMLNRSRNADHASLITRAMSEAKDEEKHEDKHEDKPEEKQGDTTVTRKFPPPMT